MPRTSVANANLFTQQLVRFNDEQIKRISRVLRSDLKTFQSYALTAIMRAVAEDEERLRAEGKLKEKNKTGWQSKIKGAEGVEPTRREQRLAKEAEEQRRKNEQVVAAPPVVIVNNPIPTTASGTDVDIERFARYVTRGSVFQRPDRLRAAVRMLHELTENPIDRQELAKKLDEAVAKLDEEKANKTSLIDRFKEFVK